jgi:hypothetical protein
MVLQKIDVQGICVRDKQTSLFCSNVSVGFKKFYQIGTTGVCVIKPFFFFLAMLLLNKLECLSLFAHILRHSNIILKKY